jgi:predicted PurR-regulated permease PerM
MSAFESKHLKQIIALAGIIILGSFLVVSLVSFVPAFLGAIIFYIICSPLMNYLHITKNMNKGLSITLIILLSFVIILVPVFFIANLLITKLTHILSNNTEIFFKVHNVNVYIKDHFGFNVMSPENIVKVQTEITAYIPNLLNQTFMMIADIGIMYFILFYLLYTDHRIKDRIIRFLPFKKENAELFAKELIMQTYSNVLGAPLLAFVQCVFAIAGFTFFGLQEPIFWGIMCGFLSFIPILGTALIWVPAGLVQLSADGSWQGIGLLIYGAIVITNVDNLFRFILQKKIADVHPLVTVFGVIIGLNWFGLPGLVFGPILISYFLIMIRIYRLEYGNINILDSENNTLSTTEIENKNTQKK